MSALPNKLASTVSAEQVERQTTRTRGMLARRLVDVICLPTSRVTPHERNLAADVLIDLLTESEPELRAKCAKRLATLADAPKVVLRYLARDEIEIARPLLQDSPAMDDSDLIATIRKATMLHRMEIAQRRHVTETVSDTLIEFNEAPVLEVLLRNKTARLSGPGIDTIVVSSREEPMLVPLALRRDEMKPGQALTMFWWAGPEDRVLTLKRFAPERIVVFESITDIFATAQGEGWADAAARKALQFIERRQRNRAALEKSPYESLEAAVTFAAERGMSRELVVEISHLSGIKPQTGAKIFTDLGGEGIAILCKSTGLKRDYLYKLWTSLRRSCAGQNDPTTPFGHVLYVYDLVSNNKAQTVLRYWNWALTSAIPSTLGGGADPLAAPDEFAPGRRSAALVWRS